MNQAIGDIFRNTGSFEKAKNYYQEAMENAIELQDKHCEGTTYLNLASVFSKELDYEMARKWYEKALYIFGTEHIDHDLKEKAFIGLGTTWPNLGNTQAAAASIESARKLAMEKSDKGNISEYKIKKINKINAHAKLLYSDLFRRVRN